jgi:hypothetical protein
MSPDERSDIATLSDLVAACLRITVYVQVANLLRPPVASIQRFSGRTLRACGTASSTANDSVDIDELWKTATEDVPALLEQVRTIQAADFGQR